MNRQLNRCVQALRIAFGLTATLAGVDKFFNAAGQAPGPCRGRRPVAAPEVV